LNDSMGDYVARQVIKLMIKKSLPIKDARILILGFTFKENCPDVRNTKVIDVVNTLKDFDLNVEVFDPCASPDEVKHEYGIEIKNSVKDLNPKYDAIVLAVSHNAFLSLDIDSLVKSDGVVYDVKGFLKSIKHSVNSL